MFEEEKPDPEEILRAIQREEQQKSLGKLKIFFGMSAGVGKTFLMLEQAQERMREGVNLLVGTINTHGRKETEAILEGLPILPEKWVKYKDTVFEELDLEKIISMKPELVIVDELAHTNVPGSKHPKRWQDVMELLDAGIDVYSTLNVQHIESRKDMVEGVTGVQVRETVPDLILERATTIELIDIPPPDLIQRLKEGKVYTGEQSQIAATNFFKEDNLAALRELALRFTAEKVEHDLHEMLSKGKRWKTREKLMVAVSSSPSSQYLIREARRLSFELDAAWVAVFVDTGVMLSDEDQSRLMNHLNLARDLGAEVVTTHDLDIANALKRVAVQKDITRIVIGRTPKVKKEFLDFFRESLLDRLEKDNKQLDIIVLRQDKLTHIYQKFLPVFAAKSPIKMYSLSLLAVLVLTLINALFYPFIGYMSVGYVYLLGILILTFFVGQGPIFFAAVLSAFAWDILFIKPFYSLWIAEPQDVALLLIYFITATVMGVLTTRIHKQDQYLHMREEKMERLYEIGREIASSPDIDTLRLNIVERLRALFPGDFEILVKSQNGEFNLESRLPVLQQETEKAAATWVFQNGKIGGWSTNTLPSAEALYIPIKYSTLTNGVLVYHPKRKRPLSMDEIDFLQTVTQQIGIYLERRIFEDIVKRQDYAIQTEKLHSAIFRSLNRTFYNPLEDILEIHLQLQKTKLSPETSSLIEKMKNVLFNVKFTVDNIIAISEIGSGFVHFEKKKNSLKNLLDQCLNETKSIVNGHQVNVKIPGQLILLPFDFDLMKLAVNNLLINALEYSPPNTTITVTVQVFENKYIISIQDEGSGIPKDLLHQIFDKFYRIPGSSSTGLGLGLAVVKSVVDIHQGTIEVENLESGTMISLILPAT